jgi:hypothetical protein
VSALSDFLAEIDERWDAPAGRRIRLSMIGSAALMLQTDYDRGTKDGDILETAEIDPVTRQGLLELAGKDTRLHARHKIYLEIVAGGLPFLPQRPRWHDPPALNARLSNFEIEVLDVVDVVVSKLKRFNSNDQMDIEAMVERGLVAHDELLTRFRAAVDYYTLDARADDLPEYVSNLNRIERDVLGVPESVIDLPDWLTS